MLHSAPVYSDRNMYTCYTIQVMFWGAIVIGHHIPYHIWEKDTEEDKKHFDVIVDEENVIRLQEVQYNQKQTSIEDMFNLIHTSLYQYYLGWPIFCWSSHQIFSLQRIMLILIRHMAKTSTGRFQYRY